MASKLFTIYGSDQLTEEIQSRVTSELKKKRLSGENLDVAIRDRSKNLGRLAFLKLHILHQEFTGKEIPAIRLLVTSVRYANQSLSRLRDRVGRRQ